jgi:signal transduction histidine kinase
MTRPPARAGRGLGRRSARLGLAVAAAAVAGVTIVLYPLSDLDPGVSSGVLYVLGVLLITLRWGLWLGLATSVASAAALAGFHGHLRDEADVVAIVVLLLTSLVGSFIADRARLRAEEAEERLRLEAELREREAERVRLEEVRASRARVLAAADAERRRVARDLHDGAQQFLVNTIVMLQLAQRAMAGGDPEAGTLVADALDVAGRANAALRELSHGIVPAALSRGGLRAGVEALASGAPLPVSLDVAVDRLPTRTEATAYFIVAEALTNVIKHARARHVSVSVSVDSDVLRVAVRDDGIGGARRDGNGLLGLDDRLAVLNGTLTVESPPGAGTMITAALPLPGPAGAPDGAEAADVVMTDRRVSG